MISSSLLDAILSMLLYCVALHPAKRPNLVRNVIICVSVNFLITVSLSFSGLPFLFKSFIIFLYDVAVCLYLSNRRLGISIVLPSVLFMLVYLCEMTVPTAYSLFFHKQITPNDPFVLIFGIVESHVLLCIFLVLICGLVRYRLRDLKIDHIRLFQWVFLCLGILLLGSFVAICSFVVNGAKHNTQELIMALPFFFLVLFAVFIILFVCLARETARRNQLSAKLVKAEMQLEQQKAMDALYHDIQGLRHDLNNHMQALSGLLERNETEKAFQYVQGITSTTGKTGQWITTKDGAVDALLNAKLHRARDAGIKVWANIQYPDPCDTPRNDVCTILFNLLDNAIEACEKNKDAANRRLRLSTKLVQNFFVIMVENPSEQAPVKTKKGFQSSKAGILHGFGLRQVKEIAHKYGGIFRVEYEETGMFRAAAMLPQNQSEWVNVSIMRPEEEEEQETVEQPEKMQAGTV